MTMLPTHYDMCEAMPRNEVEVLERGGHEPEMRLQLDDLPPHERGSLERDLTLAARIQQTLLPSRNLFSANWQVRYHYAPAGLFSGDYCDLFEIDTDLYFLLGDVSGKGLAASMLMIQLYAAFRNLVRTAPSLDLTVESANCVFAQSSLADQFATLVAGRVSRDGGVEYVSAGHLPLLHLGNACVTLEAATGIPIGIFPSTRFGVRHLRLDIGDTLLIYTDGLTEARNPAGDEYGLQRLRNVAVQHPAANPSRLIFECLTDLRNFMVGTKQMDDMTLLAIRRIG